MAVPVCRGFARVQGSSITSRKKGPDGFAFPIGLDGFLDYVDEEPVHLVVHSSSAAQSLLLALDRPEKLLSLTLVEPAFAPDSSSMQELQMAMAQNSGECDLEDVTESELPGCAFNAQINEPGFLRNSPASLIQILREAWRRDTAFQEALGAQSDAAPPAEPIEICDALGEMELQILFVRGALTPEPIQRSLDAYERCMPEHESQTISRAAHYPHALNPEEFNSALMRFLRNQRSE